MSCELLLSIPRWRWGGADDRGEDSGLAFDAHVRYRDGPTLDQLDNDAALLMSKTSHHALLDCPAS